MYVKDKRHFNHPIEFIILRERQEPKCSGTEHQVISETPIRENQNFFKTENDKSAVKQYPKKKIKQKIEQSKRDLECPSCKCNRIEIDERNYCEVFIIISKKQKHQIDYKVLGRD